MIGQGKFFICTFEFISPEISGLWFLVGGGFDWVAVNLGVDF